MAVDSVGSIVTFQETIDFGGKRRGFDFDFLAPIISDGRMYRRRIDVAIFVLSIGTISAGHDGQWRRRSEWTDVIVVQLASWVVNYSGRAAAPVRLEQGLGGWERHPNGTHVRSLTDRQQASGGDLVTQWWAVVLLRFDIWRGRSISVRFWGKTAVSVRFGFHFTMPQHSVVTAPVAAVTK